MTRQMRQAWGWVVAYMALIFVLSSLQNVPVLGDWNLNDKLKHMALFAVFAALVWRAVAFHAGRRPWMLVLWTVLIVSAYGATDEYHQSFVPGRSPDVRDWLADTAAALLVAVPLTVWRPGRMTPSPVPEDTRS